MSLIPIALPPGMLQSGTTYQAQGRWLRGNLVRWQMDGGVWALQPVGGWVERLTGGVLSGKCRCIWPWVDNDTVRWAAYGTHTKLYVATASDLTAHDITPSGFTSGSADGSAVGGYGAGDYGEGAYGTPRLEVADVQPASMWSLDNFGAVLVGVMAEDSVVYSWDPASGTGTLAAAVSGAPSGTALVVTEERFLFVLGAGGDNRKVQWCDQEALTTWTPSAINQAGDLTLVTPGKLMCGRRIRGGTLIWTDQDVHLATYIGQPLIYSFQRVGESCGVISRGAAIAVDSRAYWMGASRFYLFDGVTRPMPCDVIDGVFGDLNLTQKSKVVAYHDPQSSEIWWLYPSGASTENDRAAVYNYLGDFWQVHNDFSRTAAAARGVFSNPIMADADGAVYDHETGYAYDGDTPYAESGPIEAGDGERLTKVRELVPDERTQGDVVVTLYGADSPNASETTFGPYTMSDFVNVRACARQFRVKVTGDASTGWRWGKPRFEAVSGRRR